MRRYMLMVLFAFLFIFMLIPELFAREVYVLKDIVTTENTSQSSPVVTLLDNGGSIVYDVVYNSSCSTTHQMDWSFSKDITTLADGDAFTVQIDCVNCEGVCGFRWGEDAGSAGGANNLLSIEGVEDYEYNGNFQLSEATGTVHTYIEDDHSHTYSFLVRTLKVVTHTGFYLSLGRHTITYLYSYETVSNDETTEGVYDDGYQAGIQFCKDSPEECGISISDGYTQADLEEKYNEGFAEGKNSCIASDNTGCDGYCAVLEDDFDISMPCIDVFGSKLSVELERYTNVNDAFGFYWQLVGP